MTRAEEFVRDRLFKMQDLSYRDFHSRLMPTVDKELVIGVRTPELRKFAKDFLKTDMAEEFLTALPHRYYEENNLHAFMISEGRGYAETVRRVNEFLPFVDNWATCDMMRPKVFKNHTQELTTQIEKWMQSDRAYTVRFGIEMLMLYYLDERFEPKFPEAVARIRSDEYYVKMMVAWYFATALAKQYEAIVPFLEKRVLDKWTHNKAIQKATESLRISTEQKEYLKTLKIR